MTETIIEKLVNKSILPLTLKFLSIHQESYPELFTKPIQSLYFVAMSFKATKWLRSLTSAMKISVNNTSHSLFHMNMSWVSNFEELWGHEVTLSSSVEYSKPLRWRVRQSCHENQNYRSLRYLELLDPWETHLEVLHVKLLPISLYSHYFFFRFCSHLNVHCDQLATVRSYSKL